VFVYFVAAPMASNVVRAAGSDLMTHLLQDIAPELALRWVARAASIEGSGAPSPALCKGLVSTLLRASTRGDALAVLDVLDATAALPEEAPLARIGFSLRSPSANLHAVLYDLLNAAIFSEPLAQDGPALMFYSTAGVGSTDDADYEGVADGHSDPHVKFRMHQPKLSDVRERNVVLALGYFASVFRMVSMNQSHDGISPVTSSMSDDARSRFWKLMYHSLADNIHMMLPDSVTAVQALFGSLIACEPPTRQDEIANELVSVFNSLAHKRGSPVLGQYARSISMSNVRMIACIRCLVRIFKAKDDPTARSDRMTIKRFAGAFVDPLLSKKMSPMHLTGVPALLTTLGETWLEVGSEDDFVIPTATVGPLMAKLKAAIGRLEQQAVGCVTRDVLSTRVVVMVICSRVAMSSNRPAE
jgi:hypothetical protein